MANIALPVDADEEALQAFYLRLIQTIRDLEERVKALEEVS